MTTLPMPPASDGHQQLLRRLALPALLLGLALCLAGYAVLGLALLRAVLP